MPNAPLVSGNPVPRPSASLPPSQRLHGPKFPSFQSQPGPFHVAVLWYNPNGFLPASVPSNFKE